ncbi:MAG: hypothetical protein IJR13_00960 [Bacteroidales bacterium]|nr:hypothetical protein [Bacteroidales bacterium]
MENYSENRTAHLEEYAKENNLPVGGSFNSKGEYGHILKIEEGQSQEDVIQQFNILGNYPLDGLKEIHKYAHHLNSSQILCYNYFRSMIDGAMIDGKGHPTQELIDWVGNHIGVKITNKAECEFEYVEDKKEYTHFDFYIEEGDVKVFFEIKYTEEFDTKQFVDEGEEFKSYKTKFDNVYKEMLQKCQC